MDFRCFKRQKGNIAFVINCMAKKELQPLLFTISIKINILQSVFQILVKNVPQFN